MNIFIPFRFSLIFFLAAFLLTPHVFATRYLAPSNVKYVENKNQWENFIKFEAEFRGGKLFLEENRFTYIFYNSDDMLSLHDHGGKQVDAIRLHAVKIRALNSNSHPEITASDPLSYHNNYFIGNDPSKWASDVRLFNSVKYGNIYPGIDMKFYSSFSNVKYDIIVHPGASVSNIGLDYEGVDELMIKDDKLILKLSVGDIQEEKPYAYQVVDGVQKEIKCKFRLSKNVLHFDFPNGYDNTIPLIIDPTLVFSSFTGSTADNWGFTATYDPAGNLYTGGNVSSIGYPVTAGAYQMSFNGGGIGGNGHACDIALAKFNSTGTTLLYATYLGGSENEQPHSLVVDGNNELVIYGTSYSTDFPTTTGCYDNTINGMGDIIIAKLSVNGNSLVASTFIGGSNDDGYNTDAGFTTIGPLKYTHGDESRGEIITDGSNGYIIGSCTQSSDFPTTAGSYHSTWYGSIQDGIVFKVNSSLSSLTWSTFIGGNSYDAVYDVVIDQNGDLFIAGGTTSPDFPTTSGVLNSSFIGGPADGFVAHLTSNASSLLASTFIGTASYDQTFFVELDYNGFVYCTGHTEGNYPVSAGVYSNSGGKQFIHKMNPALSSTVYSTIFGNGSAYPNISPTAFLVDTCENVYVAGWGRCSFGSGNPGDVFNMPITANAFQSLTDGCDFYFFVLTTDAVSLLYATYFGGLTSHEHVDGGTSRFDKNGIIYEAVCAGCGGSSDFPTTPNVVSNTNNAFGCNNGVIKLAFNLATTNSAFTPSPSTGCSPFTTTFNNTSVNALSFIWDFGDGTPTDTTATPTHTFTNPGIYTVMLIAINTNTCSQNDTSYAQITVNPSTPQPASFTVSQTGCNPVTVNTQYTATWGNIFNWDFGDGTTATGMNPSHVYVDTGWVQITLIVVDTACSANSDTVIQNINLSASNAIANIAPLNPVVGCAPLNVSFSNSSSAGGNHYWDFGDGSAIDTSMIVQHTYNSPGLYHVMFVVYDTSSCNGSDTAFVDVTVTSTGQVISSFSPVLNQLCNSPSGNFSFTGVGGNTYSWDLGDGTTASGQNVTHVFPGPGDYTVTLTVSDSLCGTTNTFSQLVSFYPPVTATVAAIGAVSGCTPLTVSFTNNSTVAALAVWNYMDGSPPDFTYNATHTFTTPGTYNVQYIVADSNSCNLSDTAYVQVVVIPAVPVNASFMLTETNYCDSTEATMVFNGSGNSLLWNFGDGTTGSGNTYTHHYYQPGRFDITLIVADSACNRSDTVTNFITVQPFVHADIDMGQVIFGCAPQVVNFTNTNHSPGSYFWDFGDNTISNQESVQHTYIYPAVYNIRFIVSDTLACNGGDTALYTLHVYDRPTAAFTYDRHDNILFSDINFYNHSSVNSANYLWEFSDSQSDTSEVPPTHRFNATGIYNVCLYAMTDHGCIDTTCQEIVVNESESLYIPNAFSPNSDGINDFFRVYSTGILEMDVIIYNRWGEKIYEYFTPEGKWDGNYKGSPSPEDVYVYKMVARGVIHDHIEKTGRVSLIY